LEGGTSFLSQIARELEEEASIDVKNIISTEFQCLIFDKNNNLLEIVVKIKVDNPHFAPTDETSEFHWMEIDEALGFFKNHNNIVPLSYLLLKKAASNCEL
jgi:8-oxo-dGTP pyrophosphatase MutT (NUDIX family)